MNTNLHSAVFTFGTGTPSWSANADCVVIKADNNTNEAITLLCDVAERHLLYFNKERKGRAVDADYHCLFQIINPLTEQIINMVVHAVNNRRKMIYSYNIHTAYVVLRLPYIYKMYDLCIPSSLFIAYFKAETTITKSGRVIYSETFGSSIQYALNQRLFGRALTNNCYVAVYLEQ